MRKSLVLSFFMLGYMFLSGCASSAVTVHDFQSFPDPNENQGIVFFYRPSAFVGAAVSYDIHLGNDIIGAIKNGTYFYRFLEPGTYQFWAKTEARKEIILDVEAGNTYYIKCGVGFGILAGRPTFTVVHEVTGKNEIKGCKYATTK